MHFDFDDTVARAGLTTATLNVKTKTALLIATNLGFIGLSKKIPNIIENSSVGSRVGARCPTNWTLINID
jgi:hypothetical protein